MNEELLRDLVATAENDNYQWDTVLGKFPEFDNTDPQLLKDYVATAQGEKYDYKKNK
jgi:hypothetical protein